MQEISWNESVQLASPHPYALGTTYDAEGKPNAIGLGWWTITSWKPPMVVISVAPERYSFLALKETGEFGLCLLGEDQAKAGWICGTKSGRKVNKFDEAGLEAVPGTKVKAPLIEGSTVAYECRVVDDLRTGDHHLFIAEVLAVHGAPDRPRHLYSIHYRRLVSIDPDGGSDFELEDR